MDPHSEASASTDARRVTGRAAIGAVLATVIAWLGVTLNNWAHGLTQLGNSLEDITFPHIGILTLSAWGLTVLAIWLYSLLLRRFGERRPFVLGAVLVVGSIVLFIPLSSLWEPTIGQVNAGAFLAGAVSCTFLVVRWRLTGARLRVRVPLAVLGGLALTFTIAFGQAYAELRAMDRDAQRHLDALSVGVLDGDWVMEEVHITSGNVTVARNHLGDDDGGTMIDYRDPETGGTVALTTHPPGSRVDRAECDCEEQGDLLVSASNDAGDPTISYVEADGILHTLDTRRANPDDDPNFDVGEIADQIRSANEDEEPIIHRRLMENMLDYWRFPPLSLMLGD